jgi:aryl-alcohol dehydrogenase-like predicted oxidoreductase
MGADEAECRQIYDAFREAGGNFFDAANLYNDGEGEEILGRVVAPERDEVVVATKFTLPTAADSNSVGSHRKSLRRSVEASLRRLGTDYIDLLYVHAWDQHTPMSETVRALDDLVADGKVLAIGVSNTPAWVISAADVLAELRGWSRFCALQVEYSLVGRTAERDLLPMAYAHDLAVSAWSPLNRGLLAGKPRPEGVQPPGPEVQAVVDEVAKVAAELGVTPARVALAWVFLRGVTPVFGATSQSQIMDNLAAVDIELPEEHLARLDTVSAVPLGYPHEFLRDLFPQLATDWTA